MRGRFALALAAVLVESPSFADLPAPGERIRSNGYAIDLAQTPVLAGTRVTGLSGAFVGIAEGIDGVAQNPAGVALRTPWSTDHFDYTLGLGLTLASALAKSDVFNSGRHTVVSPNGEEALTFIGLAANAQFGRWGFGLSTDLQEYSLDRSNGTSATTQKDRLVARFAVTHTTIGYAFHDNEWLVGIGSRSTALDVINANAPAGQDQSLFSAVGAGFEAGLLFRPNEERYRLGLCWRSAVIANASPSSSLRVAYAGDLENELYLPDHVSLPWELNVGFAAELGSRPFNPVWYDASRELEPLRRFFAWRERERERKRREARAGATQSADAASAAEDAVLVELASESAIDALALERAEEELARRLRERARRMARSHVLIAASLDVMGPLADAVGVESFLERTVQRSGEQATYSPRIGIETDVIPDWTRVRSGTYLEPTRFSQNAKGGRTHFTFGFDQRLFRWEVFGLWTEGTTWMLSASLDLARDYASSGIGVGIWH